MNQHMTEPSLTAAPNLDRLFSPRAIAVVGATDASNSIGGMPMRYLTGYGYKGKVYPVNPKRTELMGLTCYESIRDVPDGVDLVLIAVLAKYVPDILRDAAGRGIPFALILSAGFGETAEGKELETELRRIIAETGIRVVGPNCLGILNVPEKMHCGFGQGMAEQNYKHWPVAMATQSGGYGFVIVKNAHREGMGFQYVASIGNSYDLNVLDFIAYFLEHPKIKVVSAFVEGITDGRRMLALGRRALEVGKPILIWKAGTTAAGQSAAASHTASMAASYALYQAAFREGGFIELRDYEDYVDITRAFLSGIEPAGKRMVIVTGSGGAGVVASDRYEEAGIELPPLSPKSAKALEGLLPAFGVISNPVDISGQTSKDGRSTSNAVVDIILQDPDVDMVMVRSQQTTGSAELAQGLADIRDKHGKPVLVTMSAGDSLPAKALFDERRVPWQQTVSRSAPVARALADFAAQRRAFSTRATAPMRHFTPKPLDLGQGGAFLSEFASRKVLDAYGISALDARFVSEAEIDTYSPGPGDFPVAVKAHSAEIPHKSEADAIRLGLRSAEAVREAAREVIANARKHDPKAMVDGVLVQPMADGTEIILGAMVDDCFGPVVMFGLGGIFAELIKDVSYGFAPVDPAKATDMIRSIKGFKLLDGYRGRPRADLDALADMLSRLSWLIAENADRISSIDINPVFVDGNKLTVADALVVRKA